MPDCHGAPAAITSKTKHYSDRARGDEGPDLHNLHIADARIRQRITAGIKGEMPFFAKKLGAPEVRQLTAYLRTLQG